MFLSFTADAKFANIIFTIGPCDESQHGLVFINEVKGGNIPSEFIPAVEKGFKAAMMNGPLAGFPVESMKVTLKDGSFHPVDSDSQSFETVARFGFKAAAKHASPVILEPIMSVEVTTPDDYTGAVSGDLNKRRGIMCGMESKNNSQIIRANVPLAELFGYITDLRTLTSGRANATLTFLKYDIVPKQIADDIIAKMK